MRWVRGREWDLTKNAMVGTWFLKTNDLLCAVGKHGYDSKLIRWIAELSTGRVPSALWQMQLPRVINTPESNTSSRLATPQKQS